MSGDINKWVTIYHKYEDSGTVQEAEDNILPLRLDVDIKPHEHEGWFILDTPGNWPDYTAELDDNYGNSHYRRYKILFE